MERIVVVGASLAGLRAAETLRSDGYTGSVVVVGAEPHHPYDRPPLSKKLLAGDWEPDRIALRKPDDMDSLDVEWLLGTTATALDVERRVLRVGSAGGDGDGDREIGFDGVVLACGAEPRSLPGTPWSTGESAGGMTGGSVEGPDGEPAMPMVTALRTLDDSMALRAHLATGDRRVVVIGAGFIGLEVAATARGLGNSVVVLEGAPAPLTRALGEEMGAAVTACHADHGVPIRCDVAVDGVGADGVRLAGGEVVPADVVVVGIGVAPATGWLAGSGLVIRDGIVCDETLTALDGSGNVIGGVHAAGDVARWHNPLFDEEMRVEHWTNAAEQGAVAARNLLAMADGRDPEPYAPVPFFWSDQYDRRIQFLGRCASGDEVQVVSGSVDDRQFLALFGRAGRLRAVLGLNLPRLVMPYRRLLAERATWSDALAHAESTA